MTSAFAILIFYAVGILKTGRADDKYNEPIRMKKLVDGAVYYKDIYVNGEKLTKETAILDVTNAIDSDIL